MTDGRRSERSRKKTIITDLATFYHAFTNFNNKPLKTSLRKIYKFEVTDILRFHSGYISTDILSAGV